MDVAAACDVPANLGSVVVEEEKRDGGKESAAPPPLKRPRFDEEVNRVAEIVLVLSSLRRIRGGKSPTDLELELMVEAKSKLVDMCQEFTPKDIIGRDAIGAVIEDLGLNGKIKDQRLGFRAPKLTISEKLSLGKRKMEESKKHPIASTTYTPPANNVSMAHQWPNSELKSSTSSVNATGSHFVRDATQSRPQFKADMHPVASQGPGGNYFGNAAATSWPAQPHSSSTTISFGTASDSKAPVQSCSRVTDPSFRPFMSQTPPGMKGVTYGGQASSSSSPFGSNNHSEIAKIIHKVLQPRAKQNVMWNPPSREYMSKAVTCQMCQGSINEVETVLICDACEKGYHLKCLQLNNMKGVPKSEWHCPRCVQLYNGKSFPPKYGRVMRSATTAKMSSSNPEVQLPPEKKVGRVVLKVGGSQEAVSHSETPQAPQGKAAISLTIEAEDAAAAKTQTVEAEDAAAAAISQTVASADSQTVKAEDASSAITISQTVEDAARNQAVDASNNESQCPIGNDAEFDEPSEPLSHSETLNPPKLENKEDPSKDATERSVSANCEEKQDSKIVAEPSLQEENSVSQTDNLPSQPPSESNTDHFRQQNTAPNVEEATEKNVTEDPQEDKSC
uniref:PHD finger protein n=1 Tax=Noccaea caerulescens TaxID=107243 RepID=A0A1J3J1I0_NOCCA